MYEVNCNKSAQSTIQRSFRLDRVKLALLTSAISKGFGLMVQFIAIPLAINSLGTERFGIYTMLASSLVWIDLGRLGIGPGLTKELSIAWNNGKEYEEKKLFSSAFFLLLFMAILFMIITTIFYGINGFSLIEFMIGATSYRFRTEIEISLLIITFLFVCQIVFSIGEATRSAYQEDYINNIMNGLANIIALFMIIGVAYKWPTIHGFTFAVFGSLALSKGINMMSLLGKSHRYLLPKISFIDKKTISKLIGSSFAFSIIQVAVLMMHNISLVQLGFFVGPEKMAPFAVVFRLLQLLSTVVLMITMPLWPAITDAFVKKDYEWIRSSYLKLISIVMLYSVAVTILIGNFGQYFIHIWAGNNIYISSALCWSMGLYFIIWMWNHSHTTILFGLGALWPVAITILIEAVLVLGISVFLIPIYGIVGLAWSFCIAGIATSAWRFPLLVKYLLKNHLKYN